MAPNRSGRPWQADRREHSDVPDNRAKSSATQVTRSGFDETPLAKYWHRRRRELLERRGQIITRRHRLRKRGAAMSCLDETRLENVKSRDGKTCRCPACVAGTR